MRKLLLLLLVCNQLLAQVSFGPKLTAVVPSLEKNSITGDVDSNFSVGVSGFVQYRKSKFTIEGQLGYSLFGFEARTGSSDKIAVINFTATPKFYFVPKAYFGAGPYLSSIVNAEFKNRDVKEFLQTTVFGITAVAGIDLYKKLFFEISYNYGISNIVNVSETDYLRSGLFDPTVDGRIDLEAKLSSFAAGIGYRF